MGRNVNTTAAGAQCNDARGGSDRTSLGNDTTARNRPIRTLAQYTRTLAQHCRTEEPRTSEHHRYRARPSVDDPRQVPRLPLEVELKVEGLRKKRTTKTYGGAGRGSQSAATRGGGG